jgi:hypothetical protein
MILKGSKCLDKLYERDLNRTKSSLIIKINGFSVLQNDKRPAIINEVRIRNERCHLNGARWQFA